MKCSRLWHLAAFAGLAACQSPGELSQSAAAWNARYQVPYDVMANCLVQRSQLPWVRVTPAMYPAERRATVTVTTLTGSALGVFDIRQVSPRDTDVAYHSIYGGPGSTAGGDALDKADLCGNPA
jgi:hypothetical protein